MRRYLSLAILCFLLLSFPVNAATKTDMEVGARGGRDNSNNLEENYTAAEIYFLKDLPWTLQMGEQTTLSSRFDLGATYLNASGNKGGMLAAGGDLVLGFWNGGLELEVGFRPTWMFDHTYGDDDFGGGMQFTSHVGLAINWQNLVLNYRLQHTSNAGIYDDNPGLNLHMVGFGYRF